MGGGGVCVGWVGGGGRSGISTKVESGEIYGGKGNVERERGNRWGDERDDREERDDICWAGDRVWDMATSLPLSSLTSLSSLTYLSYLFSLSSLSANSALTFPTLPSLYTLSTHRKTIRLRHKGK